jgi:hypothetical protein
MSDATQVTEVQQESIDSKNFFPQVITIICVAGVVMAGVVGSVMYKEGTVQIIGFCSLIAMSLLKYLQSSKTATKTAVQLGGLAKVAEDTHTLVNSNMGNQLKVSSVALTRVAELTGHPDDQAAAKAAQEALVAHEGKQKVVDASPSAATESK